MNFRELKPAKNKSISGARDKVRVSFPAIKNTDKKIVGYTMILYIGKTICEQIGLNGNDKIKFYIDEDNPKIWWIKKSPDEIGYKALNVKRPSGKDPDVLRIQMTWKEFKPSADEIPVKTVKHEIYQGGIRIFCN